MGMWQRIVLSGLCLVLLACASPLAPQATPTLPATATPLPASATPVPSATAIAATATALPASAQRPLHFQIINADAMDATPLVQIIERNAAMLGIDVLVSVRSPDGVYALVQAGLHDETVDAWIGHEYDVTQLQALGAIAQTPAPPLTVPHAPLFDEAVQPYTAQAVVPLAARNYLVSIVNTELLASAPLSTADMMGIGSRQLGRTRYRMAYSWPEGRWFATMLDKIGATQTFTDSASLLDSDLATIALQSLTELRTLGPREATTYVEATTDFIWYRVPYTLDTDVAIRRYEVYSDTLPISVAPPPIYTASGTSFLAPVDVVYGITTAWVRTDKEADLNRLLAQLQSPSAQADIVTQLRWLPVNTDAAGLLRDDPVWPALQSFLMDVRPQRYDALTICRWDVYESILPFVLLGDMRVSQGVESINARLPQCAEPGGFQP